MEDNKTVSQNEKEPDLQGVTLTSLDVLQQKFATRFRGYDVSDVDSFLELVAKELERLATDNKHMLEDLYLLKKELASYKEKEKSMNAALLTVQKISSEVKDNARKESDLIVSEARVEAEKIVGGAKQELATIQAEVNVIRQRKIQFEAALKSLLETHLRLLDGEDNKTAD